MKKWYAMQFNRPYHTISLWSWDFVFSTSLSTSRRFPLSHLTSYQQIDISRCLVTATMETFCFSTSNRSVTSQNGIKSWKKIRMQKNEMKKSTQRTKSEKFGFLFCWLREFLFNYARHNNLSGVLDVDLRHHFSCDFLIRHIQTMANDSFIWAQICLSL